MGVPYDYTNVPCVNCGLVFGVPTHYLRSCKVQGKPFFCPAGHKLEYKPEVVAQAKAEDAIKRDEQEPPLPDYSQERQKEAKSVFNTVWDRMRGTK